MRRIEPLHLAFTAVACLLPLGYVLPETFVGDPTEGRLDAPKCEVPPGRAFVIEYFGLLYEGDTANLIDRYVLCVGSWERHVLEILGQSATAVAATRGVSTDDLVFVDVGANTGLHSLYMAQRVSAVHAFDPYPPVVAKMRQNLERNQLENVILHPIGLGAEAARLPFAEPPESNQGTGSFVSEAGLPGQRTGLELEIAVGDEYFQEQGIERVDVMKVDVEGFEKAVLTGLRKTLERTRPVIVMEITARKGVEQLFRSREELEAALPQGYRLYQLKAWNATTGFYELGDFEVDFKILLGGQWDIVAAPAELADSLPMQSDPVS